MLAIASIGMSEYYKLRLPWSVYATADQVRFEVDYGESEEVSIERGTVGS